MVEFDENQDQGHTFESRKEAYRYLYYAICAVCIMLMLGVIGGIINHAIMHSH